MRFYFNTPDQTNGDIAFNDSDYEKAFEHYNHALETLQRHAASSKQNSQFLDAYTYVLADIIETLSELIITESANFAKVISYWQAIPGLLHEMHQTYQQISDRKNKETNEDKLRHVYATLAKACEEVSDEIVDELDSSSDEMDISAVAIVTPTLTEAIEWMKRAIDYQVQSGSPLKISTHLGYLHLLEDQFKQGNHDDCLIIMNSHISTHRLLEENIEEPIQKLELLGYALQIAFIQQNDNSLQSLSATCRSIYPTLSPEDLENPVVTDLSELLTLISKKASPQEAIQETIDTEMNSSSTTELMDGIEENPEVETQETPKMNSFHTEEIAPVTGREIAAYTSLNPPPPILSSLQQNNISRSNFLESRQEQPTPPVASLLFKGILTNGLITPPPSPTSNSEVTDSHLNPQIYSQAFLAAVTAATKSSVIPKFMANLLCLTADFFREYKSSGIAKQDCIMLAYDLYQHATTIEPTHRVALHYLSEMRKGHHRIIAPREKFSSSIPTDPRKAPQNCQARFTQALIEVTDQVEAFLSTSPQDIIETIDSLVTTLCKGIINNNIAGTYSKNIAHQLSNEYDNALMLSQKDKIGFVAAV